MGRDDDERSVGDEHSIDDESSVGDETTVISDGRHAAHDAGAADTGTADAESPDFAAADPVRADIGEQHLGQAPSAADGTQRPAIDPPPPDPERQQVVLPPGPALVAVGLGLLTKDGWIFQDINLTLRQSSVAAIVGPAGTGRTTLLLALVGRMEANTGTLTVAGHSLKDRPRNIRMVTSVARAGRLTAPEPGLTVSESVAERCLIEDESVLAGRSRFEEACAALRLELDPTTLVGRLAGEQATLLAVALACVRVSAVIILDDLDRDVSAATQQRVMDALIRLSKAMGPTIIVSTTDRIPVMEADVVLDLTPMDGAAIWELDPRNAPTEVISHQLGHYQSSPWAGELPVVDADPDAGELSVVDADPDADPGATADDTDGTDSTGSDYDGRWSRERWESDGTDGTDGTDSTDSTDSTDRGGGDATTTPGLTEDPR